jgi:hypothetical protein
MPLSDASAVGADIDEQGDNNPSSDMLDGTYDRIASKLH